MPRPFLVLALFVSLSPAWPQAAASLRGTITDPSGAAVPGAVIQLRGPGGERRTKTGNTGRYSFPSLARGKYQIRVIAKGFSVTEKIDLPIDRAASFDAQLTIRGEKQVLNVGDETDRVSPEPGSNGSLIMRERQLAVLSDDPDELALQLQALAGPAPGPNGGEMFIDGFSGGNLPPKSSIREVRINANPFSPEYDRPGFARVEIFTKPGADTIRGQAFAQFNNDSLNSRNPLLAQSTRAEQEQSLVHARHRAPQDRRERIHSGNDAGWRSGSREDQSGRSDAAVPDYDPPADRLCAQSQERAGAPLSGSRDQSGQPGDRRLQPCVAGLQRAAD